MMLLRLGSPTSPEGNTWPNTQCPPMACHCRASPREHRAGGGRSLRHPSARRPRSTDLPPPEPGPRCCRPHGPGRRRPGGAVPVAGPVLDLRLWDKRAMGGPQDVRPARAVPDRPGLPDRQCSGSGAGGCVHRRHRSRYVRLQRHPHRAVHKGHPRFGPGGRGLAVRGAGRVDESVRLLHGLQRYAAAQGRHSARHHRPLRHLHRGRWQGRTALRPERTRMGRPVRALPQHPRPDRRHPATAGARCGYPAERRWPPCCRQWTWQAPLRATTPSPPSASTPSRFLPNWATTPPVSQLFGPRAPSDPSASPPETETRRSPS